MVVDAPLRRVKTAERFPSRTELLLDPDAATLPHEFGVLDPSVLINLTK